jgi:hypothetical protein
MLNNWVDNWTDMVMTPIEGVETAQWDAASKIFHNRSFTFDELDDSLTLEHCGYTKTKMSLLRGLYFCQEGIAEAVKNWKRICKKGKYNSTSFHTFNHLVKNHGSKKGFIRMSVMGPCLNSFVLTYAKGKATVDVFYRTTEFAKKFPADLLFIRDYLLPEFDFSLAPLQKINFHFCNITVTPMYSLVPMTSMNRGMDPKEYIDFMEDLRESDMRTYFWMIKWHARYTDPDYYHQIANFDQARQVHNHLHRVIPEKSLAPLNDYLRDNHPGDRNIYLKEQMERKDKKWNRK